jgi:hypothetical protein
MAVSQLYTFQQVTPSDLPQLEVWLQAPGGATLLSTAPGGYQRAEYANAWPQPTP